MMLKQRKDQSPNVIGHDDLFLESGGTERIAAICRHLAEKSGACLSVPSSAPRNSSSAT